jgi:hypothetical protein
MPEMLPCSFAPPNRSPSLVHRKCQSSPTHQRSAQHRKPGKCSSTKCKALAPFTCPSWSPPPLKLAPRSWRFCPSPPAAPASSCGRRGPMGEHACGGSSVSAGPPVRLEGLGFLWAALRSRSLIHPDVPAQDRIASALTCTSRIPLMTRPAAARTAQQGQALSLPVSEAG